MSYSMPIPSTSSLMCNIYFDSVIRISSLGKQDIISHLWYETVMSKFWARRHADLLQMGAIQFIENLDRTSLTITDEAFEKEVEAAVSAIAERHKDEMALTPPLLSAPSQLSRPPIHPQISEKSGLSQPEVIPRNSIEAEYSNPRRPTSSRSHVGASLGSDGSDEHTAVSGLLRSIQRPLSSLGRMFSEELSNAQQQSHTRSYHTSNPPQRLSPAVFQPPRDSDEAGRSIEDSNSREETKQTLLRKSSAEDAAARQASAETAEAQRIQRAEHNDVVE